MVTQATKIKARVVNGINVDDLLDLIEQSDPNVIGPRALFRQRGRHERNNRRSR